MSFLSELHVWPRARIEDFIRTATPGDVEAAIEREERTPKDLAALLSPQAVPYLERMAQEAQRLTRMHFGRTITLYIPIYLSNICQANCPYCGFGVRAGDTRRRTLTKAELRAECEAIASHGFDNVLLLTGEAPDIVTPYDIADAVTTAREYFSAVSVEVYALDYEDYSLLFDRGLEGVTLYQETYDRPTYERLHEQGVKRDFAYRLDTLERAGMAGVRRLNLGALLGLFDWRVEGTWMALHARYLQRICWQSAVAVSFPRLRHAPENFAIAAPVNDRDLVQLILATRLFLPEAGLALSTRERALFRDHLIPLGITNMSAGSSTRPGGYATCGTESLEQFEIEDSRTPQEVVEAITKAGYDPVWKDFDRAFHPGG